MISSPTRKAPVRAGSLIVVSVLCGLLAACGGQPTSVTLVTPQQNLLSLMRANGATPVYVTGTVLPAGIESVGDVAVELAQALSESITRTPLNLTAPQARGVPWESDGIRMVASFDPGSARRDPAGLCRLTEAEATAISDRASVAAIGANTALTVSLCSGQRLDAAYRTIGDL